MNKEKMQMNVYNKKRMVPEGIKKMKKKKGLGGAGGVMVLFTNPSARAGYDTRSIFKRSLTGFEFRVFLLLD